MALIYSFPKLTDNLLDKLEGILHEKFDYPPLPKDYRDFLLLHNGGYVSPGYINDTEEYEHEEAIVFDTPLKWAKLNNKPVVPSLYQFYGAWLEDDMDENEVQNWDLFELVASNNHSKHQHNVLPENMMSIAKCDHPDGDNMLCMSLDKDDYGSIYYYYGMYNYPAQFMGSYYVDQVEAIKKKYNIEDLDDLEDLEDMDDTDDMSPDSTISKQIHKELTRVPFVKVAGSFQEFLRIVRREKNND